MPRAWFACSVRVVAPRSSCAGPAIEATATATPIVQSRGDSKAFAGPGAAIVARLEAG